MGTFTSCSSLITLNFRTTINGVPSFSSTIHRKPQFFNDNFGLKFDSNNSCYLCQKVWKRNLLNTQKNRGLFDRLMCFSRGSDEDGDGGNSSNDSNLATKEKERAVEDKDEGVGELRSENKPTSFSSSEPPPISPVGTPYNNFQVDSFKLMELLGPEKVDCMKMC